MAGRWLSRVVLPSHPSRISTSFFSLDSAPLRCRQARLHLARLCVSLTLQSLTMSLDERNMASSARSKPLSLTMIVATTPSLGIGKNGNLPWPPLKNEMAYFARVTKRAPSSHPTAKNAVIMGRKTWESIPLKFRPLKDRINVVITRNPDFDVGVETGPNLSGGQDEVLLASNLQNAIELLEERNRSSETAAADPSRTPLGKAFIIGGSTIYKSALDFPQTDRILLTKINNEFDCDAVFPVDLEGESGKKEGWVRRNNEELSQFVGEEVEAVQKEEKGVAYTFCMFEKE